MKFGSLFSGIGGIDLGLERAGMVCRWQSEIDPYASRVLAKHWPHIQNLGDIRDIDWTTVEPTDVVAGGYPCQPFSYAGARAGADDPRHLWPMFAECIRMVRPRYALLENVTGHLSLGFGQVLADLASLGYDTEWDCIPAAAVGAPHRRDRVFIIATRQDLAHADSAPSERGSTPIGRQTQRTHVDVPSVRRATWTPEPDVGRMADGIPARVDRLRGLGNAVVPQVAEHVGRIIMGMADA
ncbi:MAG: DNA cytosine methyltransferase [Ilumatobacteraceae bacterium]